LISVERLGRRSRGELYLETEIKLSTVVCILFYCQPVFQNLIELLINHSDETLIANSL